MSCDAVELLNYNSVSDKSDSYWKLPTTLICRVTIVVVKVNAIYIPRNSSEICVNIDFVRMYVCVFVYTFVILNIDNVR